jgi:hypothetical protein
MELHAAELHSTRSCGTASTPAAAAALLHAVRVEDAASIGRSYTSDAIKSKTVAGLGATRRQLRTRTFDPYADGKAAPVVHSLSLAWVNLRCATREQVQSYFENTWALTDTLFSVSGGAM